MIKKLKLIIILFSISIRLISAQSISDCNELLNGILSKYVNQYSNIDNQCDAVPYYKINFTNTADTIMFWIGAHLGMPGLVPPIHPDSIDLNPKELKGVITINKIDFVLYDFKNSNGYGIYDTNLIDKKKLELFDTLPEECVYGTLYPEAWQISLIDNRIFISDKREPYILK